MATTQDFSGYYFGFRGWFGKTLAAIAVVCLVSACGSSDDELVYEEQPVEILFNRAMDALEQEEFALAAREFDEVERQHPYSPWATRAQVLGAFSHYSDEEYDEAIAAIDRFVDLHPAHPDVPYVKYLKGLSYYDQISDIARDQQMTIDARRVFTEVVTRYPESEYARDARIRIDLCNDHLAGQEMVVGRYYLRRGYYLAAINRFRVVIDTYQTTTHAPEALLHLTEAYTAVGLTEEARRSAAVLGHNFPGSVWYADAYTLLETDDSDADDDGSWF
jgi:outer membrane protein assembly factor BamD